MGLTVLSYHYRKVTKPICKIVTSLICDVLLYLQAFSGLRFQRCNMLVVKCIMKNRWVWLVIVSNRLSLHTCNSLSSATLWTRDAFNPTTAQ